MIDFHILSYGSKRDDGTILVGTQVIIEGSVSWETKGTIPTEDVDDIHSLLDEQLAQAAAWIALSLRSEHAKTMNIKRPT